jgi:hypothetical protein
VPRARVVAPIGGGLRSRVLAAVGFWGVLGFRGARMAPDPGAFEVRIRVMSSISRFMGA